MSYLDCVYGINECYNEKTCNIRSIFVLFSFILYNNKIHPDTQKAYRQKTRDSLNIGSSIVCVADELNPGLV